MSTQSGILADEIGGAVWLRLLERGCFQNSPDLEKFIIARCEAGRRKFVVDLAQCVGMDSTFMGTLMGAGKRLKKLCGCLEIINAAGRNAQLLRGLGVHYFCAVAEDSAGYQLPVSDGADVVPHENLSKGEHKAHCLNAHVELVEGCDANKSKFADVVQLMQEDQEKSQKTE